jgi:hypothetical protein
MNPAARDYRLTPDFVFNNVTVKTLSAGRKLFRLESTVNLSKLPLTGNKLSSFVADHEISIGKAILSIVKPSNILSIYSCQSSPRISSMSEIRRLDRSTNPEGTKAPRRPEGSKRDITFAALLSEASI